MKPTKPPRGSREGSTLVLAVFVVALLGVLIGLAFDYTANTSRVTKRAQDFSGLQSLANGALEVTFQSWGAYMKNNQDAGVPSDPTDPSYTASYGYSGGSSFVSAGKLKNAFSGLRDNLNATLNNNGYTVTELTVVPVDRADNTVPCQSAFTGTTGPLQNVPGWTAAISSYRARAVVAKNYNPVTKTADMTVSVSRYFQQADASLYQAMVFTVDDMEIHPGRTMTLFGLVHTNSNLYAASGAGCSLTFQSNVSYVGDTATLNPAPNFKYEDPRGYVEGVTQTLYNQENNWGNFNAPFFANSRSAQLSNVGKLSPLGDNDSSSIIPSNPNASGTHEIIERPAPSSSTDPNPNSAYTDPAMFKAHRVFNGATLRIFINHKTAYSTKGGTPQNIHVYQPDPSDHEKSIEISPGGSVSPNIVDNIINAITLSKGNVDNTGAGTGDFHDFRQLSDINVNTVDMSLLTPALNAYYGTVGKDKNVVYITDTTNADTNGNEGNYDAVRLRKGAKLPDGGLTVATDGAIYVQGDYNTGDTYGPDVNGQPVPLVQPVSNANVDPTQYTVPGYSLQPAAVLGDAVMILSNAWQDTRSSLDLASRIAIPTTFNSALVSGQVLTTASAASGGIHNFPRFLEDWSGKNFTYHGSMCELYSSIHFTGIYGHGNVYSPPVRRWFFETSYILRPPPGNLRTTTYTRGRWVRDSNS